MKSLTKKLLLNITERMEFVNITPQVEEALDDTAIDGVVAGIVPLTPAMQTLAPGEEHHESILDPGSIARLLPEVAAASDKPLLAVVDSGVLFDPLADVLQAGGLPVFRSADRAVRALGRWVDHRTKLK